MSLQREIDQKKESDQKKKREKESENKKEAKKNEKEKAKKNATIERKSKGKQKNFYARTSGIKETSFSHQPMIVLLHKETFLNTNELNPTSLSSITSLLQEYEDVFLNEALHSLPSIRGIEHQIDFMPGATIPNWPACKSNPEETKEFQRQVNELMEKGYVRESISFLREGFWG